MSSAIDNNRFRKLLSAYPAAAVEQLYLTLGENLERYAYTLTRDHEAAKDIVQESFLYVLTNSKKLSAGHERSIERYIVRIVRNMSVSYFNRVKHLDLETLLLTGARSIHQSESAVESNIIETEIIADVRAYISTFPPRERECFVLMIDHNLSLDEIAQRLNVTRKAVEANLTRSRKRLRKWAPRFSL